MDIKVYKTESLDNTSCIAILAGKETAFDASYLTETEYAYVKDRINKGDNFIYINQYKRIVFVIVADKNKEEHITHESVRKSGNKVQSYMADLSFDKLIAFDASNDTNLLLAFTEGILLGAYNFSKYQKKTENQFQGIKEIGLIAQPLEQKQIDSIVNTSRVLYKVRNLVNEPVSYLTAEQLAIDIESLCKTEGCTVEVLNKSKIEALKMGGLLAVNKGSVDPPTFTIIEWKPSGAINTKPYILVGKGVVYDTGGLSLKPTPDSMDYMKCDMSGAAVAAGTLASIAANKLPIYVVALIPATDNRPGGNAYAPGDVITMMDGTNVEMLNADAEGRMILADALCYAKRYNPELVIDIATLTGSASMAIGPFALVAMGNAGTETMQQIADCGKRVFERIVEFPLWDDYAELIKSDIADIKNIGGKNGGAITAGKFLEHFTAYPWVHFDIAGVAFNKKADSYRGKGGSGFGMRLLFSFFSQLAKK